MSPPVTSNYQISCTGPHGTGNSNVATVTVLQPSADIIVNPTLVSSGSSTNVSWAASNVTSCTVTGTDGYSSGPIAGPDIATTTVNRTITAQTKYTISCPGQSVTSAVLVNVVPGFEEF